MPWLFKNTVTIKLLTFIGAYHVTYVIEAGVNLDDDFPSGRLAAVLHVSVRVVCLKLRLSA